MFPVVLNVKYDAVLKRHDASMISAESVSLFFQVVKETGRPQSQEEQAGFSEVHRVPPPREGRADRHRGPAAQPVRH